MKLFRIYCGLDTKGRMTLDQAREIAIGLARGWFTQGYTIIEATGHYQQSYSPVTEPAIIIEILTTSNEEERAVYHLAKAYKDHASLQEAVMITMSPITTDYFV